PKVAPREAAKRPAPNDEQELNKKVHEILANYENEVPAAKVARVSAQVAPRHLAPGPISQGNDNWFVVDSRKNKYRTVPKAEQQKQPAEAGRSTSKVLLAPPTAAASSVQQQQMRQQYYREAQQENWARAAHAASAVTSTEGCGRPGNSSVPFHSMIVDPAVNSYAAAAAAMPDDCLGEILDEEVVVDVPAPIPPSFSSNATLQDKSIRQSTNFKLPGDRPDDETNFYLPERRV
ncbi:hypothetical protein PFISCL1PPCAC_247, partial [Pristionchus fissidentatus]